MTNEQQPSRWVQGIGMIAAALYGIVVVTGVATVLFIVIATWNGTNAVDLYAEIFPRFRGNADHSQMSGFAYAVFAVYIAAASYVAILSRRRSTQRWAQRLH